MVDLYYALYGTKRPTCLPHENDEIVRLYKPQRVQQPIEEPKKVSEPIIEKMEEEVIEESVVMIDEKVEIFEELKKEKIEDIIPVTELIPLEEAHHPQVTLSPQLNVSTITVPPPEKKPKLEYFSENSVSLPGVSAGGFEQGRPVGFEPGMFEKQKEEDTSEGKEKMKKKKKDKKKHKHKKHKHKSKDHEQSNEHTL